MSCHKIFSSWLPLELARLSRSHTGNPSLPAVSLEAVQLASLAAAPGAAKPTLQQKHSSPSQVNCSSAKRKSENVSKV